jgi:hypothetical protein
MKNNPHQVFRSWVNGSLKKLKEYYTIANNNDYYF